MSILKKFSVLSVSILFLCMLTACSDNSSDGRAMNDATAGRGILENAADDVKDTAEKMTDDVKDGMNKAKDDAENAVENAEDDLENKTDDIKGTENQMK